MKRYLTSLAAVMAAMAAVSACGRTTEKQRENNIREGITNPLTAFGSSPCLTWFEGKYYYCQSSYVKVALRCTESIDSICCARENMIYYSGKDQLISAPRMYNIDGVWYIYYSSDDGEMAKRNIHVLRNPAHSPLEGSWEHKAVLNTGMDKSLHPSVFRHRGQLYLFWSGSRNDRGTGTITMGISCCRLSNPWTIASRSYDILNPEYEWECQWAAGDPDIDTIPMHEEEAPVAIYSADSSKVLLYFAASHTMSKFYCEGMAICDADDDLTDPSSWTKLSNPVFMHQEGSDIYGPGHISFVQVPSSNELYFVYHAYNGKSIRENIRRNPRIQKASWDANGIPVLGVPAELCEKTPVPSWEKH